MVAPPFLAEISSFVHILAMKPSYILNIKRINIIWNDLVISVIYKLVVDSYISFIIIYPILYYPGLKGVS